jgi:hypothetical protein
MSDQQNRFMRARSMQAHDQVLLAIIGTDDLNVSIGKAAVAEPLRHSFRSRGHISDRIGGVDLDQLFEYLVGELSSLIVKLRK